MNQARKQTRNPHTKKVTLRISYPEVNRLFAIPFDHVATGALHCQVAANLLKDQAIAWGRDCHYSAVPGHLRSRGSLAKRHFGRAQQEIHLSLACRVACTLRVVDDDEAERVHRTVSNENILALASKCEHFVVEGAVMLLAPSWTHGHADCCRAAWWRQIKRNQIWKQGSW